MSDDQNGLCDIAIVTGAGSGIGRACAQSLASAGLHVIITGRSATALEATHLAIEQSGGKSSFCQLDVTRADAWISVVKDVSQRYGPVSTLVNNAALKASLVPDDRGILDLSMETFDRMIEVNLRGPVLGIRTVLPAMLDRGSGSIINISSAVSIAAVPFLSTAYGCAKAGLNSLTRSVAVTYGTSGIRCNTVAPGVIVVDDEKDAQREFEQSTVGLTGRAGRPSDIGAMVGFLASDAARFINGQVITVDGGLTTHMPGLASPSLTEKTTLR
jgi:NAD(P)-dependent dehydrogenase (short-subunit alcohol dehydrogenase family)